MEEAIQQVLDDAGQGGMEHRKREGGKETDHGIQSKRVTWLRRRRPAEADSVAESSTTEPLDEPFTVAAMGPLGHLYVRGIGKPQRETLAVQLVHQANVPLVLLTESDNRAKAFTTHGTFMLPDMAEKVLGRDDPFLDEVARDLLVSLLITCPSWWNCVWSESVLLLHDRIVWLSVCSLVQLQRRWSQQSTARVL